MTTKPINGAANAASKNRLAIVPPIPELVTIAMNPSRGLAARMPAASARRERPASIERPVRGAGVTT